MSLMEALLDLSSAAPVFKSGVYKRGTGHTGFCLCALLAREGYQLKNFAITTKGPAAEAVFKRQLWKIYFERISGGGNHIGFGEREKCY